MSFSFYIDELYNDLRINNRNMVFVSGADNVVQQIRVTLRTEFGEWFLNTGFGLPYYSKTTNVNDPNNPGIFGGTMSAAEIEAYIVAAVLQVPGVVTVDRFEMTELDRSLRVEMKVTVEEFDANGVSTQYQQDIRLEV